MSGVEVFGEPAYARLMAAARRSLERTGGALDRSITLDQPSDAERRAVIGLTGVHRSAGAARITLRLADLDRSLRQAVGHGLTETLAALGGPVRDRPAERAAADSARAAALRLVEASPLAASAPWFAAWSEDLDRGGMLTRLVGQGAAERLRSAVRILEHLDRRSVDASPIMLPALAAALTGDTKALNRGAPLATLVLRALALREGVPAPVTAPAIRDLWDRAGVVVDDLASRILVLNLRATGPGLGEWLTGAADYGTPFQLTYHQLASHPITVPPTRVFVCENPAVLRRAAEELGPRCPPLLCGEGQPSTAFHRLARTITAGGGELLYHGDFDWPGITIAVGVLDRHGAHPWRMSAADYQKHAPTGSGGIPLRGHAVPTSWDPALAASMESAGRAVYEEQVADDLLADLERLAD